jgi:hypothetical protein
MPLELTQIDSFGYTPGVAGFTSTHTRGYFPNGSLASYNKLVTNHFASNGLKDSMTYSDVLKGLDLFGYKINYNTQGDPVASHGYDVQTSQAIEIYTTKYYYEAYGTNVGIEKASLSGSHVSLFPNPVSGHFTLSLPDAKPGSAISVRITNTSGQLVHAERFTMQGTSRQIILEDEAAPGTYYLSVYDEQGRPIGNRSFLKL